MNIDNPIKLPLLLLFTLTSFQFSYGESAPWQYQLGATLGSTTWSGDNGVSGSSEFSSQSRRLGFQFSLRKQKWYAGVGFNASEFDFNDGEPDREPVMGPSNTIDPTVSLGQLDITGGYYFLPNVSAYIGIKNYGLTWAEPNYKVNYSGIGAGLSGFHRINDRWLMYASIGVTSLNAKSDNASIGGGESTSVELGGLYQWSPKMAFTVALQSQNLAITYDNSDEQNHEVGGLFVGIQYGFNKN